MKKRIVKLENGKVAIVIPSEGATLENIERDCKRVIGYVSHRIINDNEIPTNRLFRDAWSSNESTNSLDIDLVKCKEIIRAERDFLLELLDKKYLQESRKPVNNLASVNIEAQRLRDITGDVRFNSSNVVDLESLLINEIKIKI